MKLQSSLCLILMAFLNGTIQANDQIDHKKINGKALDYIEGWFEGNVERMNRCLHPDLAKRGLFFNEQTKRNRLGLHSKTTLVEGTRIGRGKQYPKENRDIKIKILDVSEDMASVKVTCMLSVEYLHLAKYDDEWLVMNVLWKPIKPE